MDLMQLRRNLLMGLVGGSESVGIFTKGYEATLTPQSASLFTITHNLGIVPRVCFIEYVPGTMTNANYTTYAVIDFNSTVMNNDKTGWIGFNYYYNNSNNSYSGVLPSSNYTADTTEIKLNPLYSSTRTPWDTSASYKVYVWG